MLFDYRNSFLLFASVVLLGGMMSVAHADDDDDEGGHKSVVSNAKWQAECGSCHVAFPPRLLPAESWRAMMSGLDRHFGSDASLEARDATEIGAFLEKHASKRKHESTATPLLRITETRWFKREHREVAESVWNNPKVKSPANCVACHIQAESGDYRERNIKVPR
jgi:hypothetical protein